MPPPAVVITSEFRTSVERMLDRLGAATVSVGEGWEIVARSCGVASIVDLDDRRDLGPLVVFGAVEVVIERVHGLDEEFGFVVPAARRLRWWQREKSLHVDPTIKLWQNGWSPVVVERFLIAADESSVELVVGNARRTPGVSAFDDGD